MFCMQDGRIPCGDQLKSNYVEYCNRNTQRFNLCIEIRNLSSGRRGSNYGEVCTIPAVLTNSLVDLQCVCLHCVTYCFLGNLSDRKSYNDASINYY